MVRVYIAFICAVSASESIPKECGKLLELQNSYNSLSAVINPVKQAEGNALDYVGTALGLATFLGHPVVSGKPLGPDSTTILPLSMTSALLELFKSSSSMDSQSIIARITDMFQLQSSEQVITLLVNFAGVMEHESHRVGGILRALLYDRDTLHITIQSEYAPCISSLEYDVAILDSRVRRLSGQINTLKSRFPDLDQCILPEVSNRVHEHYFGQLERDLAQSVGDLENKQRSLDAVRILQGDSPLDRSLSFV